MRSIRMPHHARETWLDPSEDDPPVASGDPIRAAGAQPSRAFKWSPTPSALATMVSAGFTAALEGKKLPSTT